MKNLFTCGSLLALTLMVAASGASPAFADRYHDDDWGGHRRGDWHDNGYHRGWDRGSTIVIERPRYIERDVYVNDYRYIPHRQARPVYVYNSAPADSAVTCTTNYNPLPAIVGATGGGIIGAQIGKGHGRNAAIVSGVLIGGLIGNSYTYADQVCTRRVFETAQVGAPLYWNNPDTGYNYTVTPVRDYQQNGRYCREYTATARVGGKLQETYGTACYQPDGSWEIIN